MLLILTILIWTAVAVTSYGVYKYARKRDWAQTLMLVVFLLIYLYMGFSFPYKTEDVVVPVTRYEVRECEAGLYLPQFDQTISDYRSVMLYRNEEPDSLILTMAWSIRDGYHRIGVAPQFH